MKHRKKRKKKVESRAEIGPKNVAEVKRTRKVRKKVENRKVQKMQKVEIHTKTTTPSSTISKRKIAQK